MPHEKKPAICGAKQIDFEMIMHGEQPVALARYCRSVKSWLGAKNPGMQALASFADQIDLPLFQIQGSKGEWQWQIEPLNNLARELLQQPHHGAACHMTGAEWQALLYRCLKRKMSA